MDDNITLKMPNEAGMLIDVKGKRRSIASISEPWAQYTLDDGVIVQVKNAIIEIVQTEQKDTFGNPVFVVKSQPIVNVIYPNKI